MQRGGGGGINKKRKRGGSRGLSGERIVHKQHPHNLSLSLSLSLFLPYKERERQRQSIDHHDREGMERDREIAIERQRDPFHCDYSIFCIYVLIFFLVIKSSLTQKLGEMLCISSSPIFPLCSYKDNTIHFISL